MFSLPQSSVHFVLILTTSGLQTENVRWSFCACSAVCSRCSVHCLDHRFTISTFAKKAGKMRWKQREKKHFLPHNMATALPVVAKTKSRQNVGVYTVWLLFIIYNLFNTIEYVLASTPSKSNFYLSLSYLLINIS